MGEQTRIPWCDSTWNWCIGCTKISEGCANCYAEKSPPAKFGGIKWGDSGERRVASVATFNAPLSWNRKPWVCDECGGFFGPEAAAMNCCPRCSTEMDHYPVRRRRVFSLSLGDWLDPKIPTPVLARALDIVRRCENLDFLMCSKRPQLFQQRLLDCIRLVTDSIVHEETSEKRAKGYRSNSHGRTLHRQPRKDLAQSPKERGPMERRGEASKMRKTSCGVQESTGVSSASLDPKLEEDSGRGPSSSVADRQRRDTRRYDDQPQERQQAGQQAKESGVSDLQRQFEALIPSVKNKACGRSRGEASENQADKPRCGEYQGRKEERDDGEGNSQEIPHESEDHFSDLHTQDLEASSLISWLQNWLSGHQPKNVWILVSAENQKRLDERVPHLLRIPAVVRGLSCEPLLGPIDFDGERLEWLAPFKDTDPMLNRAPRIDWIIVGGESGPKARPCNVEWIRSLKDQCQAAGVACFVKQLGGQPKEPGKGFTIPLNHPKGGDPSEWPEDLRIRQFPTVER